MKDEVHRLLGRWYTNSNDRCHIIVRHSSLLSASFMNVDWPLGKSINNFSSRSWIEFLLDRSWWCPVTRRLLDLQTGISILWSCPSNKSIFQLTLSQAANYQKFKSTKTDVVPSLLMSYTPLKGNWKMLTMTLHGSPGVRIKWGRYW